MPEEEYIAALLKDAEFHTKEIQSRPIQTIFFCGGTPSLLSGKSIFYLLTKLQNHFVFAPNIEMTLEANPGTVDQAKFFEFYQAGINRLSLGVQSFSNQQLLKLGRIHDADAALSAIQMIRDAGFKQFNIDMMYGLPNQTVEEALEDLTILLQQNSPHVSWYQLTLEPNTAFYHQPPTLPNEDELFNMQQAGLELIQQHGFQQYEVSAYAKENFQCKHNVNYWEFGDYLGIGAGAHSKLTNLEKNTVKRFMKLKHPQAYLMNPNQLCDTRTLSRADLIFEFMLNALRLKKEIPEFLLLSRTGLSFDDIKEKIHYAQSRKWLHHENKAIVLSELGWRFLNNVTELFLP